MDIEIECTDIAVESMNSYGSKLLVKCYNADENFLDSTEVLNYISVSDYVRAADYSRKTELLFEVLDYSDISEVLNYYKKEDILEHFTMDEILDYFKDNMIKHL